MVTYARGIDGGVTVSRHGTRGQQWPHLALSQSIGHVASFGSEKSGLEIFLVIG